MSNSQVSHNVYFEGMVQSLGLETEEGRATVGVMKKGTFSFSTSSAETIVIISGLINIKPSGGDWNKYGKQDTIEIGPNTGFEAVCETDVAYICYYR
jgi:hypothetical protein